MTLADDCTVHFTPVVAGAGKSVGFVQAIVGVALIAVAWWNPLGWTAGTAMMVGAWWNPLGWTAGTAMMVGAMGASMAMGGVMQMLARPPDMNTKLSDSEKQQSTSFSNIRNLTPQGRPIPLLYGKMMTSLILISQGIDTFDDVTT
ncbi:tail assembly protein [Glaesserella parasuis]|nr:tail assembly protein [Glaesserella parasuis]